MSTWQMESRVLWCYIGLESYRIFSSYYLSKLDLHVRNAMQRGMFSVVAFATNSTSIHTGLEAEYIQEKIYKELLKEYNNRKN
jgi:hypothetical protein